MTKSEEAFKVECFTGEQEEEKKWRVVVDQKMIDCDAENAESYWKQEVKEIVKKGDREATENYRAVKKPEEKGDGDKTDGETEDEKKGDGETEDDRRKMSRAERDTVCLVTMFVAVAALWGF